ncbi:hypothetical protein [Amycolatopsis granulosa]|uniref:hypothetical protein n=1 Tax=Amycolatopsis granulosa TaxID=185684 RepID=UPI00142348A7|nr:hypothetical protein [Amycolatopsis granulosa]NIH84700.1 hypothetical protein [Amycolatopsis granulosa]
MNLEDLADAAAALRKSDGDALKTLVSQVMENASQLGLRTLPARVDSDIVVTFDAEAMTAQDVVAAAGAVKAGLLYLNRDLVDRESVETAVEGAGLPDTCPERDQFLQALRRAEGWTSLVELGFAHQGVLHVWETAAPWHFLLDAITTAGQGAGRYLPPVSYQDPDRLSPEDSEALAQRVAALPEFRRAGRRADRNTAAEQLPEMAELSVKSGWQAGSVVRRAEELLRTELVTCIGALKPRTAELAALLAADPAFRQVSTALARQRFADEWLLAHSDGLRLESWFVKEIAVQAHRAVKGDPAGQQLVL